MLFANGCSLTCRGLPPPYEYTAAVFIDIGATGKHLPWSSALLEVV